VHTGEKPAAIVLGAVVLCASTLYLSTINIASFGAYHDDGIYVVTAKALATGRGYRITSLPWEPAETKYPPLYSFVLSLVWRVNPGFPGNLPWMMSLSGLGSVASLVVVWFYFTKRGYASSWQSLLIVTLVAFNWRTAVFSTGIYSEQLYTALAIAALFLTEECEERKGELAKGMALGVLLGAAFLTRASGFALIAAVGLYFLVRKGAWKGVVPFGLASIAVLGWAAWSYLNRSQIDVVNAAYYTNYLVDFRHIVASAQAITHESGFKTILEMTGRNAVSLLLGSVPLVCLGLPYSWADHLSGPPRISAQSLVFVALLLVVLGFWRTRDRSGGASLVQIYVLLYVVLHLPWPYAAYDRFLMPLLPFLLLFLIRELARIFGLVRAELGPAKGWSQKIAAGFVGLVLLSLCGGMCYAWAAGARGSVSSKKSWDTRTSEDLKAIDWINQHSDPTDVIVCYRDPTYYLYTGLKATRSSMYNLAQVMPGHDSDIGELERQALRIVRENNARYLVLTSTDFELEYHPDDYREAYRRLVDQNPDLFALVFKSESGARVYRIGSLESGVWSRKDLPSQEGLGRHD